MRASIAAYVISMAKRRPMCWLCICCRKRQVSALPCPWSRRCSNPRRPEQCRRWMTQLLNTGIVHSG
ncbi:hypothetical protein KCP75_21870 [Salmonella enterica subsp. enterica]|nr:hypothetical protein KCP75_21870 [Salmonella enterica subsp. enterica]